MIPKATVDIRDIPFLLASSVTELSVQVTLALCWNWSGSFISSDFGVGKNANIEECAL